METRTRSHNQETAEQHSNPPNSAFRKLAGRKLPWRVDAIALAGVTFQLILVQMPKVRNVFLFTVTADESSPVDFHRRESDLGAVPVQHIHVQVYGLAGFSRAVHMHKLM